MAEFLFIRLTGDETDCRAIVINDAGRVVQRTTAGPLASLAALAEQRRVIVLVPGSDVVTTEANLPPASAARLRQMLPYSLEDTFAEDVDRLLFAAGRRLDSGPLAVSVLARDRMDAWLTVLKDAGLKADAIYAETDGVPDTPSTLHLLLEGERIYGRRPGHAAFVFEGLGLQQGFELLQVQTDEAPDLQHLIVYTDEAALAEHEAAIAELRGRLASVDVKAYSGGILPHFAATLVGTAGTNLLQGPYAPKSNWGAMARPWHAAASLLVATIVVAIAAQAVEYFSLRSEDQALTQLLSAQCNVVAGTSRLTTCATTVQRRLSDAGAASATAGETFLSTLSTVAEFYEDDSVIEALSYRNRVMDIQMVAPSVPSLDTFRQQIMDTDRFIARIQSANPSDSGVEGRIQVVGAENR